MDGATYEMTLQHLDEDVQVIIHVYVPSYRQITVISASFSSTYKSLACINTSARPCFFFPAFLLFELSDAHCNRRNEMACTHAEKLLPRDSLRADGNPGGTSEDAESLR